MTSVGNKNFLSRILFNQKVLALIGLTIIVLISFPLVKNLRQRHRINQEIEQLNKEIANLETRNVNLKELLGYLESDQFVEEQARLNLGFKKQGEEVVVIKDENKQIPSGQINDKDNNLSGSENEPQYKSANCLQRWWRYFFKD